MSFKFTLVLLAVAVVAIAAFGLAQRQSPPASSAPSAAPTVTILDVPAGSATSLDVKTKDHETALTKNGSSWQLTKPEQSSTVDQTKVNNLVNQLYNLSSGRSVAKQSDDLSPYGLKTPQITAALSGGGKTETLLIGDKNINGDQYYAMRQEGSDVGLIPSSIVNALTSIANTPPLATPTPSGQPAAPRTSSGVPIVGPVGSPPASS